MRSLLQVVQPLSETTSPAFITHCLIISRDYLWETDIDTTKINLVVSCLPQGFVNLVVSVY